MRTEQSHTIAGRAEMAIVGGLAGLSAWALVEKAQDVLAGPHVYLAVSSFVAGFFAVLLGLSGPHKVARAALPALILAAVAALLFTWSALRFDTLDEIFSTGHLLIAWAVLLFVGTPIAAVVLCERGSFSDYVRLFDVTWSLMVRYCAAWLFVGVFWGVLFLSDALLEIVGVTFIQDLLEFASVPYVLSGLALGLGLSVVHEMRDYLSPYLLVRMLRLLVPVVLGVVLVFVGAALLQNPADLFGDFSQAGTLLTVALVMISLVSISLERSDEDAVQAGWMRKATAALALLLPVFGAMAVYALWLRVVQYGWTPGRMAAATVAGIVVVYGLSYAVSVALRGGWMARIRRVNVWIAGLILAVAAAWMTPLLNAERIATQSQVARYLDGRASLQQVALWEMAHDWGRAGQAGLEQLVAQQNDQNTELKAAILAAQDAQSQRSYQRRDYDGTRLGLAQELLDLITIVPADKAVTAKMLSGFPEHRMEDWSSLCRSRANPGCVLVLADFGPNQPDVAGLFLVPSHNEKFDAFSVLNIGSKLVIGTVLGDRFQARLTEAEIWKLLNGDYKIAPSSTNSMWIGETELLPTR